jgi:hypothetical protein
MIELATLLHVRKKIVIEVYKIVNQRNAPEPHCCGLRRVEVPYRRKEARMVARIKTKWIPPSNEIINAFEAGIRFGIKMELRRPHRDPLWTEAEWQRALTKALRKSARPAALHKR